MGKKHMTEKIYWLGKGKIGFSQNTWVVGSVILLFLGLGFGKKVVFSFSLLIIINNNNK
jgi:hypothetical protein